MSPEDETGARASDEVPDDASGEAGGAAASGAPTEPTSAPSADEASLEATESPPEPEPEPEPEIEDEEDEEISPPMVRPPVLASEALRRDLAPATPGRGTLRVLLVVFGALGALAVAPLAMAGSAALPVAGALGILALLGLVPMPFAARAAAVVAIGSAALTVTAAERIGVAGGPVVLVLEVGVLVLGGALVFRSWHRASWVARLLVFAGAAVCGAWLWLTHALVELTILDTQWQAWLPRVAPVALVLVLLLSLLAFMDARSTGGCGVWAGGLLVWYALYQWAQLLARAWPVGASSPTLDAVSSVEVASGVAGPILVVFVAFGLAQLLAVAAHGD